MGFFDTITSFFTKENTNDVENNNSDLVEEKELTKEEIYELAIKYIKETYPEQFEHVAIIDNGECDDVTYTFYNSDTTISSQKGYMLSMPYTKDIEDLYNEILKFEDKRYNVNELKNKIKDYGIKINIEECKVPLIDLEVDKNGKICKEQSDYIVKKSSSISTCKDCGGDGYKRCPDEECKGRHQYKCPECRGEGEFVCSKCHGKGELTCDRCGGKGEYTCKSCKGEGFLQCPDCKGKQTVICKECKGNGKKKCTKCNGNGYINGNICTACAGEGTIRCKKCHGKGVLQCETCHGKGEIRCRTCGGDGKVVCTQCDGNKKVTCRNCGGKGKITCEHCNGNGEIICSTCLGDKEHYGKVKCNKCLTTGKIARFKYIKTSIKKKSINDILKTVPLKHPFILKEIYKPQELIEVYSNRNGERYLTKDAISKEILGIIDSILDISKDNENPTIIKQELTYQKIRCVFIKCKHILAQKEFNISVLDILGNNTRIIFPNYDDIKKYETGFFQKLGLILSKIFKTKKYYRRIDAFSRYKLFILMAKADKKNNEVEKRKLLDEFTLINELTPDQKNALWETLNMPSEEITLNDIEFSSQKVAEDTLAELTQFMNIDNNVDELELKLLEQIKNYISSKYQNQK